MTKKKPDWITGREKTTFSELKSSRKGFSFFVSGKYKFALKLFNLLMSDDPSSVYKLREYTRKVLNTKFKDDTFFYKDSKVEKGLIGKNLGDNPEDKFVTRLARTLTDETTARKLIGDLRYLPGRVKDDIETLLDRRKKQGFEPGDLERTVDANLIMDAIIINEVFMAIKKLTPREQQVVNMRIEEFNNVEIARELGITEGGVRKIMKVVEGKLRKEFSVI